MIRAPVTETSTSDISSPFHCYASSNNALVVQHVLSCELNTAVAVVLKEREYQQRVISTNIININTHNNRYTHFANTYRAVIVMHAISS